MNDSFDCWRWIKYELDPIPSDSSQAKPRECSFRPTCWMISGSMKSTPISFCTFLADWLTGWMAGRLTGHKFIWARELTLLIAIIEPIEWAMDRFSVPYRIEFILAAAFRLKINKTSRKWTARTADIDSRLGEWRRVESLVSCGLSKQLQVVLLLNQAPVFLLLILIVTDRNKIWHGRLAFVNIEILNSRLIVDDDFWLQGRV